MYRELARFDIGVVALSETRLTEERNREIASTYTIFWKVREVSEQHVHGAGLAVKTKHLEQHNLISHQGTLDDLPDPTQPWCFPPSMHIPLSDDAIKDSFYDFLDTIIRTTPVSDKLVRVSYGHRLRTRLSSTSRIKIRSSGSWYSPPFCTLARH